jgi:glycosyltransferase involved in cell wall biosynthesis
VERGSVVSDTPRVSVIVPVFNAGDYLDEALRSVAAQTYRDHEVVVVDDGSTDPRTRAILDAAAGRPGVHVHRTANRGPAHARNLAIERARGAYILPLDADDYLAPEFLARTVPVLDTEPEIGIVHTWVALVGDHRGVWRTGEFSAAALVAQCTVHVTSLYRRQVWTDVGGYDPRFVESCEDWDFWLGAAERGWRARAVPEVLAYYRRTPTSRELLSRTAETSTRLMRDIVAKHRGLYETHLEDALTGMYRRLAEAGVVLERVYRHPAVRLAGRLRALLRRAPAS